MGDLAEVTSTSVVNFISLKSPPSPSLQKRGENMKKINRTLV